MTTNTTPSQPVAGEGVPELLPCPFQANGGLHDIRREYGKVRCRQHTKWMREDVWNTRATQPATGPSDERFMVHEPTSTVHCNDSRCPVGSTIEGWPHPFGTPGCIYAATVATPTNVDRDRKAHRQFCSLCHEVCRVDFHVPDQIWQLAMHVSQWNSIVCLQCFTRLADERGVAWDKGIEFRPVSWITHENQIGQPFNEFLAEQMCDPEFATAYREISAEVDAEFIAAKARRAVEQLKQSNTLLADPTEAELASMVDIIAAEFSTAPSLQVSPSQDTEASIQHTDPTTRVQEKTE